MKGVVESSLGEVACDRAAIREAVDRALDCRPEVGRGGLGEARSTDAMVIVDEARKVGEGRGWVEDDVCWCELRATIGAAVADDETAAPGREIRRQSLMLSYA